jgi:CopG family nickel-responsive transcriptional regulator
MSIESQTGVDRFGVSLPEGLLEEFDAMVKEKGYDNRSLAIADIIRGELVEHRQNSGNREIAGSITLVYDHHKSGVQQALTELQHDHPHEVIATLHVHLDHDNCLEVIVLRGKSRRLKKLAAELIAARGVKHGKFTVASIGSDLIA